MSLHVFPLIVIHLLKKWSESSWKECGETQGVFLLLSSTFQMLSCLKTCSKSITSFLGLLQLCHSQINGSFPGSLPDLPITVKAAGARSRSVCPNMLFPVWTFSPFYRMDMESKLHDTKVYGFLKCDAMFLLYRWLCFGRTLVLVYQTTWHIIPECGNVQSH